VLSVPDEGLYFEVLLNKNFLVINRSTDICIVTIELVLAVHNTDTRNTHNFCRGRELQWG